LRTRLHSRSLDRALADGCESGADDERALRAKQLVEPLTRRRLARSLRQVVAEAEHALLERFSPVPVNRPAVISWRQGLLGLADRLERTQPINPCGTARIASLVGDSDSPLYSLASPRPLGDFIWWAADGLSLCPPHAWDSPVIMKVDPERVAWTCRRCGAIATSGDPSAPPG
jgi:hypothetical protein